MAALQGCGGGPSASSGIGPAPGGPATRAAVRAPEGLAFDASGTLYVSEFEGHRVDAIAPDGRLSVVAGTGTAGFSGDGGPAAEAQLNAPTGLATVADGRLIVADHHNNRIRVIDRSGTITSLRGSAAARLFDPIGIALADDGSLYIADELNARVVHLELSGRLVVVAAKLGHPSYVVLDGAKLIFSDFFENRIRAVDSSGVLTTISGTGTEGFSGDGGGAAAAELSAPTGLALDARGNLYVSDSNNNRVRKIDASGLITTIAGNGTAGFAGDGGRATAAELNAPAGLAIDRAGNLYIADQGNNRVRRMDASGVIATVAGRG